MRGDRTGASGMRCGNRRVSRGRGKRCGTGNLNKAVANRLLPELDRIAATCRAGKDAEALRALASLKHRYGYH